MIRKEPEEFISSCSRLINEVKSNSLSITSFIEKLKIATMLKQYLPTINQHYVVQINWVSMYMISLTTDSAIEAEFAKI